MLPRRIDRILSAVPGALPRARFATGRAADLCDVDVEQLTRDDLRALGDGGYCKVKK